MMCRHGLLILVLLSLPLFSPAGEAGQPATRIAGRVTDSLSGEPLPGATVLFARDRGVVTGPDGDYELYLPPGTYHIVFRYVGYQAEVLSVTLAEGRPQELAVALKPAVTEIDQVVVSASRVDQRLAELTVSVSLIKPESIAAAHTADPRELMNRTSGVEVLDGQASIRGGSGYSYGAGSRVMALVDGLPLISPDAGGIRWRSLPLENISQVEVIKGASSVMYGSSALNGIIHFRTAEATAQGSTRFYTEAGLFGRPRRSEWVWWESPRAFASASVSHLKRYGNTDVGFGSYLLTDNGYRRLNDERLARANLRLKHRSRKVDGLSYGLNLNAGVNHKRDFILWEDAWQGALKQDPSTEAELNARFFYVDPFVSLERKGRSTHALRARLQSSDNHFPVTVQNNSGALGFYAEYQGWQAVSERLGIHAGLMQHATRIRSNFYGDHHGLNLAAYAQAELDATEKLRLVAGMRVEHSRLDGEGDPPVPLFRAGVNRQVGVRTFMRASFGQGYRYPSVAERHASTTLGAVRIFPNPGLKAESGWNAELGVKQGVLTRYWNGLVDLALFYGQNRDLIEYVFGVYADDQQEGFDLGFKARNIEHSRVYGAELELSLTGTFGGFENALGGGYVFMVPVEFNPYTHRNTGTYLKFRRHHSARLSLSTSRGRVDAGMDLFVRSRILNIDDVFVNPMTREGILPGFFDYWTDHNRGHFLADLHIGYRLDGRYRLSLVVKNLTNAEYMGRPGDIQPHRNISLRLSGSF
jgi:iron complex outermembrane receptor protein